MRETCWTAEYVLAHCERYRVESDQGTLGYVDEVIEAEDAAGALGLLVRTRDGGSFTVEIDDVLELHPSGERIVVRSDLVEQLAERAGRQTSRRTVPTRRASSAESASASATARASSQLKTPGTA